MIGEILGNRYEIKKLIGEGGMALVYLAQDNLLDRPVAIKLLRSEYSSDQEFVERFQREAKSAAKLCHPNVVNIYDVGQTKSTYYIVMEYIEGTSLKDLIKKEGTLSVELSLNLAMQISSALNHAHNSLIVHRDIKPHNIMITNDYLVKVMDFGIARAMSSATITRTGVVLGSVHYFSPEQATGKDVTSASDLYSLGIVLYEMLTGKVPFDADTPVGIAYQHVQSDLPSIEEKRPDLPPSVIDIVKKALAKKPEERFKSAREMELSLSHALDSLQSINVDKVNTITKINRPENEIYTQKIKDKNIDSTMVFDQTLKLESDERDITTMSKKAGKAKKRSNKNITITAILLLLLIVLPGYLFVKVSAFLNVPEVNVPDVIGLTDTEAKSILAGHKLVFEVESESFDSTVPKGHVISQMPESGRLVKVNRSIRVILSKGPELLEVPDVTNMDIRGAQVKLQAMALDLGDREYIETDEHPPGTIISQSPEAFEKVERGSKINIQVSKAPLTRSFSMPNLINITLNEAKWILARNGLELGEIFTEYDSYLPEGYVIDHNPGPESEVVEGSTVDITISKKGEPSQTGASDLIDQTPTQTPLVRGRKEREVLIHVIRPGQVKIVVIDEKGSREAYSSNHREGDIIQKTVGGVGVDGEPDVFIQVWINGVLQKETVLSDITQ